jgi:phosphomethylpyrimidine synthase
LNLIRVIPAEGLELFFLVARPPPKNRPGLHARRSSMNAPVLSPKGLPQTVTTGPIYGSRKIYAAAKDRPDIRVPLREIALSDPNEPTLRVYDPSGPYTENDPGIDLAQGLRLTREPWILSRGYEAIQPRAVKPEDNGNISADKIVAACPAERVIRKGAPGQPVTQYEFARAGIITEEMIYVAHRENLARDAGWPGEEKLADGESFGAALPAHITPSSCAPRSRAGAPSSRRTSTTPKSSR